eukprot:627665-Pelagomonas_calceolata.AAC.1
MTDPEINAFKAGNSQDSYTFLKVQRFCQSSTLKLVSMFDAGWGCSTSADQPEPRAAGKPLVPPCTTLVTPS